MSGRNPYRLEVSANFQATYEKVVRNHYSKKRRRDRERFEALVRAMLAALEEDPVNTRHAAPGLPIVRLEREPWPTGGGVEGWELWKARLVLPGMASSAQAGRVIYAIHNEERRVVLIWIYTHGQFPKRPPESDLRRAIAESL